MSPNVASFVGATTVRVRELGYADRPPTAEELARMQDHVRNAMREGAMGVGSSLIYANTTQTAPVFTVLLRRASGAGVFGHFAQSDCSDSHAAGV